LEDTVNVRVFIVEDHPMLRHGLGEAVAQGPQLIFAGDAATGAPGLALARRLTPDFG
jgi:DNA-binding NarL/FixJ family response regulator